MLCCIEPDVAVTVSGWIASEIVPAPHPRRPVLTNRPPSMITIVSADTPRFFRTRLWANSDKRSSEPSGKRDTAIGLVGLGKVRTVRVTVFGPALGDREEGENVAVAPVGKPSIARFTCPG